MVPACAQCDDSQQPYAFADWMRGKAQFSPSTRGVHDVEERVRILEEYLHQDEYRPGTPEPRLTEAELVERRSSAGVRLSLHRATPGAIRCLGPHFCGTLDSSGRIGVRAERRRVKMSSEFTAVVEKDGKWFIAYSLEVPGANGQGKTKQEALESLAEAIRLILDDRREEGLRGIPPDATVERISVR